MTKLRNALTCALILAGIFAMAGIGTLAFQLRESLPGLAGQADKTLISVQAAAGQGKQAIADGQKQLAATSQILGKVLLHVDRATGEAAIAARQQRVYWETISAKTSSLLDSGKQAIQQASSTIQQIGVDSKEVASHSTAAIDRLGPVINDLGQTARTATGAIEALDIPSVNASFKNVSTATGNLAASSEDIKQAVHRLTRPAGLLKTIAKGLIGLAPAARAFVP